MRDPIRVRAVQRFSMAPVNFPRGAIFVGDNGRIAIVQPKETVALPVRPLKRMSVAVMQPIEPLRFREWDDGNTEFRKARAWGYKIIVHDSDGDGCAWSVTWGKTGDLVAYGEYPGNPSDDFDKQFEVCQRIATEAAWNAAKAGVRRMP